MKSLNIYELQAKNILADGLGLVEIQIMTTHSIEGPNFII